MQKAAVQLGMDTDPDIASGGLVPHAEIRTPARLEAVEPPKDFFITRDGKQYAGTHLIVDFWGADRLDDLDHIEAAMRDSVDAAGATLLHIHLHHFTPNHGVSGVAVLAESHISVHTWPEHGFAAFDVFMCGEAEPLKAVEVLERAFAPDRVEIGEHLRGRME